MRTAMLHGNPAKPNTFHHDQGFGEFYVGNGGVTYSDPRIAEFFKNRGGWHDTPASEPWMPDEASKVLDTMRTPGVTVLTGDLGSGKSTVMYGVRTMMRVEEESYTVINGHYLTAADRIADAIDRLRKNGAGALVYDSFDYLFMWKRNKRAAAATARPVVLNSVHKFLDAGGTLLATMHTDPWMKRYSNPDLTAEMHQFVDQTGAEQVRVNGYMRDNDALSTLGAKVIGEDYGSLYATYASQSTEATARTYRVMKLLGRELGAAGLLGMAQGAFDEQVQQLDDATRDKMGAPADYAFLPPELMAHHETARTASV
jgi:hypothetical protein